MSNKQGDAVRVGVTETVCITNKQALMIDVSFLINLFAGRGNDWDKIHKKLTENAQQVLHWMSEKSGIYTIKNNPGTLLPSNVVTIPRMAACFSTIMTEYFHNGYWKILCGPTGIALSSDSEINRSVFCSYSNALLPVDWVKRAPVIYIIFFSTFWLMRLCTKRIKVTSTWQLCGLQVWSHP